VPDDTYTLTVTVDATPDEADARVRDALQAEGFGILTEIDVEATLRTKLGEEIGPYRILGACNPALAHRAISIDPDVGAMLPCNVVIRANPDGGTDVVAADPAAMLAVGPANLDDIAADARARIQRALQAISA
jgi:uncharacterized protein (DUF302 family)